MQTEEIALITRMLIGWLQQELSEEMRSRLAALLLPTLEDLGEALLDSDNVEDWLSEHC